MREKMTSNYKVKRKKQEKQVVIETEGNKRWDYKGHGQRYSSALPIFRPHPNGHGALIMSIS